MTVLAGETTKGTRSRGWGVRHTQQQDRPVKTQSGTFRFKQLITYIGSERERGQRSSSHAPEMRTLRKKEPDEHNGGC